DLSEDELKSTGKICDIQEAISLGIYFLFRLGTLPFSGSTFRASHCNISVFISSSSFDCGLPAYQLSFLQISMFNK
ncbi:MAG TPA: hypothetical protein VHH33_10110, partial [Nitrososphaeraceae archaeon]|nr:hypothetical protein [Nitrososphaeraceae archaeon]